MSSYVDLWLGPGVNGGTEFPVTEMVLIIVITVVLATLTGSLAAWKHEFIEHFMEGGFEVIGRFVGKHPVKVAGMTLVICLALSSGMSRSESETDASVLWVPKGAVALDHMDYVDANWPSASRPSLVLARPSDGKVGPNVLTPELIQALFAAYEKIMAIEIDGDQIVKDQKAINDYTQEFGGKWTYLGTNGTRRICFAFIGDTCGITSVLDLWGYNKAAINALTPALIKQRIDLWEATPRMQPLNNSQMLKTFEIEDVLGGIGRDAGGSVQTAELFSWSMFSAYNQQDVNEGGRTNKNDPIFWAWEAEAVCVLGVQPEHPEKANVDCSKPGGLDYVALFSRSFGDEFGNAVRSDVAKIAIAYFVIIIYLLLNLGKRDSVHSMITLSFACVVCVGLAYSTSAGIGAIFGVKTNPLNNNIPFLILGLGVDDAFVLAAEFTRHCLARPDASPEDLVAMTAKSGGVSVLITSLTDGLAFLVGSSTKLPALSAFCLYAGMAVLVCFVLQIFIFLPMLALNAQRTSANRFDLFCCLKSRKEHALDNPQGCCCCILAPRCNPPDGLVARTFEKAGNAVVRPKMGKIISGLLWLTLFAVGVSGLAGLKKDFKLEFFFPEDSYVNNYLSLNSEYFGRGTSFNFYTTDTDMFAKQDSMNQMTAYILKQNFIQQSSIKDWWFDFSAGNPSNRSDATIFWQDMWQWYSTTGNKYRDNIQWVDKKCNAMESGCNPNLGIAHSKTGATLNRIATSAEEFEVLDKMRKDIREMFADDSGKLVFPYSPEFLYWEETGVIDIELTRNLIIAGGVIFAIICLMIPRPRIAIVVAIGICMSIIEVMGFMYYWGGSVNGVFTIYLLICVGLAVDYSAHIAHVFKESDGSCDDRAVAALSRIGPSVFHALISTILAVVVLGFSKSYVFKIFFKILFLVTMIAGFKGLWLLPVVLSVVGGDRTIVKE